MEAGSEPGKENYGPGTLYHPGPDSVNKEEKTMNENEARALIETLTLSEKLALLTLLDTISEENSQEGSGQE